MGKKKSNSFALLAYVIAIFAALAIGLITILIRSRA